MLLWMFQSESVWYRYRFHSSALPTLLINIEVAGNICSCAAAAASAVMLTCWNNNIFFFRISDQRAPSPGFIINLYIQYLCNNSPCVLIAAKCCTILYVLVTPGWLKMTGGGSWAMTGQTDRCAAVIARLAGPRLSFPRLAEVGGDREKGDQACETGVGGVGGTVQLSGRDLLLALKQKPYRNRPRGTFLEMNTPFSARKVARGWIHWVTSVKGWQVNRKEKVGIVLTVTSKRQLKGPVNATWSNGSCPKNTFELKSGSISIALISQ